MWGRLRVSDFSKCQGIACEVRNTCRRYTVPAYYVQIYTEFYAHESFRPATGCEYYWPAPGIEGRMALGHAVVADFDKAREP